MESNTLTDSVRRRYTCVHFEAVAVTGESIADAIAFCAPF